MAEVYVKYNFSKTQLGNGGFGCVYSGVRVCDGKEVAVKVIEKNKVLRFGLLQGDRVPTEVVMLKKIASPSFGGVVRMLDYYKWNDYWFIVMERPKVSQDLFDYISEKMFLDENTARNFMAQVLEAVRHCRSRNIIHMDIKEENLLLDLETGELKLIDFGSAEYIQDTACDAFCGTKECMPPEMITGEGLCRAEHAEVWSLGVLLYGMVHGRIPFMTESDIVQAKVDYKDGLSDACKDLISQCLRKKPEERATLDQILDHPWIAKVGLRDASGCQPSEFEGIWSSRFGELTIGKDEVETGRGSGCRRSGCSVIQEEARTSEILIPQEPKTPRSNSVCCFSLTTMGKYSELLMEKRCSYIEESLREPRRVHYVAYELWGLNMITEEELDTILNYPTTDKARRLIDAARKKGDKVSAAFMKMWDEWRKPGHRPEESSREALKRETLPCSRCGNCSASEQLQGERESMSVTAIVEYLDELSEEDFNKFKWCMVNIEVAGNRPMPKRVADIGSREDVAEIMVRRYNNTRKSLFELLDRIPRRDLIVGL